MSTINAPRGMRDFLPEVKRRRERMLSIIRNTYRAYGFAEIETPALEEIERLFGSEGGENQKMTFNVLRRRLKPEEFHNASDSRELVDLGLRYDLTVPLSRFYATNRAVLPGVFRAIQIGPVWRAERPQRGRYRQFMQCDIDIIGESGVLAEAELFQATGAVLDALGVAAWQIRVNSRVFLMDLLTSFQVPAALQPAVFIELDKLDKTSVTAVINQLAMLKLPEESLQKLAAYLQQITANEDGDPLAQVSQHLTSATAGIQELLSTLPANVANRVVFDPLLIRGMGYYTGLVYEITVPDVSYSIGGGGRYDGMIEKLSGVSAPAVGMSLGFERLVDLVVLSDKNPGRTVALIYDRDVPHSMLLAFKAELVQAGDNIRLEARPRKLPELLNRLSADGVTDFATIRKDSTYLNIKTLQPVS